MQYDKDDPREQKKLMLQYTTPLNSFHVLLALRSFFHLHNDVIWLRLQVTCNFAPWSNNVPTMFEFPLSTAHSNGVQLILFFLKMRLKRET